MSHPGFTIRDAVAGDVAALRELDLQTGHPVGRSDSDYSCSLSTRSFKRGVIVLEEVPSKAISGFLVVRAIDNEWEVENIVVSPRYRRRGLGLLLVDHVLSRAAGAGAVRLALEVRSSNTAAIALYRKIGFQRDGLRPDYYSNPAEDALLFSLSLRNSS